MTAAPAWLDALTQKNAYPDTVLSVKMLETHISWVFLTGHYAYKIKKPVDFGFIDYTTLEKRHYFCEQEVTFNHALAPQVYLEVIPIVKNNTAYQLGGSGEIVEYAVKMSEFSQDHLLTHILRENRLTPDTVDSIAIQLAHFHMNAQKTAPDAPFGNPQVVHDPVLQNFSQIKELLHTFHHATHTYLFPLEKVETLSVKEFDTIHAALIARKQQGFIRSCHGDLHLGNITLIDNKPVIFDCIEFNDFFRWTDVMADVGFLMMDFYEKHHTAFAIQFLNTYLTYTGDYTGLIVLPYYFAYRAMVRGKIELFNLYHAHTHETQEIHYQRYLTYVTLAQHYLEKQKPFVVIMHGLTGSGKSTLANAMANKLGAIVIRSDVERKRLFHLTPNATTQSAKDANLYQQDATEKTYARLHTLAKCIIDAHYPVIIDAAFLHATHRTLFSTLAQTHDLPFIILHCEAHDEILTERITHREQSTTIFSDATLEVLQHQKQQTHALLPHEHPHTIIIDTHLATHLEKTYQALNKRLAHDGGFGRFEREC